MITDHQTVPPALALLIEYLSGLRRRPAVDEMTRAGGNRVAGYGNVLNHRRAGRDLSSPGVRVFARRWDLEPQTLPDHYRANTFLSFRAIYFASLHIMVDAQGRNRVFLHLSLISAIDT